MFVDDDYVNLVDDPTSVEVEASGCVWMGCLYERKSGGGVDLFYDHANEATAIELDNQNCRRIVSR